MTTKQKAKPQAGKSQGKGKPAGKSSRSAGKRQQHKGVANAATAPIVAEVLLIRVIGTFEAVETDYLSFCKRVRLTCSPSFGHDFFVENIIGEESDDDLVCLKVDDIFHWQDGDNWVSCPRFYPEHTSLNKDQALERMAAAGWEPMRQVGQKAKEEVKPSSPDETSNTNTDPPGTTE